MVKQREIVEKTGKPVNLVGETDKHLLYGLYKQATTGNAPRRKFSFNKKGKGKTKAWKKLQDIPEETLEEAFRHLHQALDILKVDGSTKSLFDENGEESESSLFQREGSSNEIAGAKPTAEEPSSSSSEGETAEESEMSSEDMLLLAAGEDDVTTLKALLDKGVKIDHCDDCGQTALHMAADHGSVKTLKVLLERGASVSAADQHGVSVLQAAVIAGHVAVAKILLEAGADPNQTDEDGDSPMSCAWDDGSPEMQELFDDGEEEEEDKFEQESTISWDTEFTMDITSPHKIIDRIPSILDK